MIHRQFAEQIIAEQWTREFTPGKGWKEGFVMRTQHNHWLDCTANAIAAADILGTSVLPARQEVETVTLSELQRQRRGDYE